jgi:hypothetical protein
MVGRLFMLGCKVVGTFRVRAHRVVDDDDFGSFLVLGFFAFTGVL